MKYGGLRVSNPRGISEAESPDCRNEIIRNNQLHKRTGLTKTSSSAINKIMFMFNPKSGFCKENYKLIIDSTGRMMIDPDDLIPIPQKEFLIAYWQMEGVKITVAIPQKASIIAYWKMEDSA